jgi:SAM-dependent methyltransferase
MDHQPSFFDFAAEVGLTKHLGGVEATQELVKLCQINEASTVLDVGCGVGVTPCFLAQEYGCEVVGIDHIQAMIEKSQKRAKKEGVTEQVEFKVADAHDLPFDDDTFDVVMTESVVAVLDDKQKAMKEFVRVTKPTGYVGLNESTWLKYPPPPEIVAWVSQDIGGSAQPLTSLAWVSLLDQAELHNITAKTIDIDVKDESKELLNRYGILDMLGVFWRMLSLYLKSSDYRDFVRGVGKSGVVPKKIDAYFAYGLFVGQKKA